MEHARSRKLQRETDCHRIGHSLQMVWYLSIEIVARGNAMETKAPSQKAGSPCLNFPKMAERMDGRKSRRSLVLSEISKDICGKISRDCVTRGGYYYVKYKLRSRSDFSEVFVTRSQSRAGKSAGIVNLFAVTNLRIFRKNS